MATSCAAFMYLPVSILLSENYGFVASHAKSPHKKKSKCGPLVDAVLIKSIDKLCAVASLTVAHQQKLKALCLKYADIFNDGTRPLLKTNLAKFKVELANERKPISCPPTSEPCEARGYQKNH